MRQSEFLSPPSGIGAGNPPAMMNGMISRTVTGYVKWFDSAKGYGFVKPSDGEADILLHQSCVRHSGFKTIREGATVVCEAVPGPRGLQATKVVSLDNSTAQAQPAVTERQKNCTAEPCGPAFAAVVKWFNRAKAMALLHAAPARPTFSFIWKLCGAVTSWSCAKARTSRCGWGTDPRATSPPISCWSKNSRTWLHCARAVVA
jgi:cold shock CspA family protein